MQDLNQLREWSGCVSNIANGYKKSRILFTAFTAGVFDLLEEERDAGAVAAAVHWSERGTAMLLDGLVAMELLTKHAGRYRKAGAVARTYIVLSMSFDMSQQAELSPRRSAVPRWFLFADNAAHLQPVNQAVADPLEPFLRNVAQAGIDGGNINASQTCHTDDRSGL